MTNTTKKSHKEQIAERREKVPFENSGSDYLFTYCTHVLTVLLTPYDDEEEEEEEDPD